MATKTATKKGVHQVHPSQREQIRARNRNPEFAMESPDPTPVHIPGKTDQVPPLSLRDEMQRYIKAEISNAAAAQEMESFEEANDFEIEDDNTDILSPYSDVVHMTDETDETLDGRPTADDLVADQGAQDAPSVGDDAAQGAAQVTPASDAPESPDSSLS